MFVYTENELFTTKTFYMNPSNKFYRNDYYVNTPRSGSSDITKVVIGALAGAVVGTLVAGAFTEKGVDIRHRVGKRGKKMAQNIKHKVSDVKHAVADKFDNVKEGAADLIQKGKEKVGISKKPSYASNNMYAGSSFAINNPSDYEENHTGKKILIGAAIASVAGAVIWAFATEKGKETRKHLAKSGKSVAGTLKEKASHIKEAIADVYEVAKEGANDLIAQEQQKIAENQQRTNSLAGTASTGASTTGANTYNGGIGAQDL